MCAYFRQTGEEGPFEEVTFHLRIDGKESG